MNLASSIPAEPTRRRFMAALTALGLGAVFESGTPSRPQDRVVIDEATVAAVERVAGLEFTAAERKAVVQDLGRAAAAWRDGHDLPNGLAPSFGAVAGPVAAREPGPGRTPKADHRPIERLEAPDLAFAGINRLGRLLRRGAVTSVELTRLFLKRLEKHDRQLHCVITSLEPRALAQAEQADEDLKNGHDRGPLHGIPWGVKDLMSVPGYRTTWGAKPFENQIIDETATVVRRLDEAGAVLLAKLSVGALAMGDRWFGERTRSPWNPERGSSGSSAGPAAAVAAGLVPFTLGTETLGSIVSPCTRCGVTGIRPTFGRVSRHGTMALSWTMDKIGPIARSVRDAELVLETIAGPDGLDGTVVDRDFGSESAWPLSQLRVGALESLLARGSSHDQAVIETLKSEGVRFVPVKLPRFDGSLRNILNSEVAASFDEITRDGRIRDMVSQRRGSWPRIFRAARMIPAVEYLQASRLRTRLREEMATAMKDVDVFVSPSFRGGTLSITNYTGHPCICVPNGFGDDGSPRSISFIGSLFGERDLATVARAYQEATDHHLKRPPIGS